MTAQAKPAYHHGNLRHALLEAAIAEIDERGIEGFSLRGVAKRAGVSHAAPAHHFGDAPGLLTALAASGFGQLSEAMEMAAARIEGDPSAKFTEIGIAYIDFALENPAMFRLMFSSKRPDFQSDDLLEPAERAFNLLVDGVASVRGRNPLEHEYGRCDVAAAWAAVHGAANLLIDGRMKFLQEDLAEPNRKRILVEIIRRSLPGLSQ